MKAKLRIKKLAERKSQNPLKKKLNDQKILKKILAHPLFKKAKLILFYLPIQGEVDLSALLNAKLTTKKTFVLPRTKTATKLDLHAIKNLTQTKKGRFNIPEPLQSLPKIKPQDIDLILAPGVVFAKNGHRIGYGKGFYDRLLKKTTCPKIGIAYDFQIVNNIAGQPHDVPMDMIITEKRTLKI